MKNLRIVFTKPWRTPTIEELALKVSDIGFDGVELAVRPGYQVTPDTLEGLGAAVAALKNRGLDITSVAGEPSPGLIAACGECGIGMIRTMVGIDMKLGYRQCVDAAKRRLERLVPDLRRSGVRIGIQNHCDYFIGSAMGLMDLLEPLSEHIGAILDLAHCALDGEPVDMAIDIAFDRILMVNLKSAFQLRTNGPNAREANYRTYWSTAKDAAYSWQTAVDVLRTRAYDGPLCICAEYSNEAGGFLEESEVDNSVRFDLAYLDELLDVPEKSKKRPRTVSTARSNNPI